MSVLKNMMIEITNKCNQSCPICEASVAKRKKVSMNIKLGLKIINALINDGVETLSFTGGEPTLCWGTLVPMLRYCKDRSVPTRLYTNGIALDINKIKILETCLDDVVVSVDSINPEIIKLLRGTDKNLSVCIKNIRMLTESTIRVIIISTCTAVNYNELIELALELENYKIDGWWIQQFIPKGIGKENVEMFKISDDLFYYVIGELKRYSSKKIRSFPVISTETKRVFINCEGKFVDYETGMFIGFALDARVRHEVLNSRVYRNIKREI